MSPMLFLIFAAFSWLICAACGKHGQAVGGAAVIALGGYFANNLSGMFDQIEWLKYTSAFYYFNGDTPVIEGWNAAHVAILAALPLTALACSLVSFNRRDVAV